MNKKYITSFFVGIFLALLLSPSHIFANPPDEKELDKKNIDDKLTVSYLYNGSTDSMIRAVDETEGTLDIVLPAFFEVNASGNLEILPFDERFIEEMHKRGIKVVPYVSNHWVRSVGHAGMNNRDNLSTQIANAVKKYNFDGVDIDIENLNHTYKDEQTDFMKQLREKLPEDKMLTLAIAANPKDLDYGWHGSYDYTELAKYVDYFFMMTYDERTIGSGIGPTASYDFVENSIKQLVDIHNIAPEKLVLGVPFYGRYWKSDGSEMGGYALTNEFIETLRLRYGGTKEWHEEYKTPYTSIYLPSGATLGGRTLSGGYYTFYYEDLKSLIYKIRLVHKYDLKGYGSWNLNMANDKHWKELEDWANGEKYYFDMMGKPHEKEAAYSVQTSWFKPEESGKFIPNKVLRKGDVAVILSDVANINPIYTLYPKLSLIKQNPLLLNLLNANPEVLESLAPYHESISQDYLIKILDTYDYQVRTKGLDEYDVVTKIEMAYLMYQITIQEGEKPKELETISGTVSTQ